MVAATTHQLELDSGYYLKDTGSEATETEIKTKTIRRASRNVAQKLVVDESAMSARVPIVASIAQPDSSPNFAFARIN